MVEKLIEKAFTDHLPDGVEESAIECAVALLLELAPDTPDTELWAEAVTESLNLTPDIQVTKFALNTDEIGECIASSLAQKGILERAVASQPTHSTQIEVGAEVLALLSVDGEWHPGIVAEVQTDSGDVTAYVIRFEEFAASTQRTPPCSVIPLESAVDEDGETGEEYECCVCTRVMPITLHHVIPKETHTKYLKLGYSSMTLATTIPVCRPCHNAIHRLADNSTLAAEFNTLEKIMATDRMQKWRDYAKRQRTVQGHQRRYMK